MPFALLSVAVLHLTAALAAAQLPERGPPPALLDAEGVRLPPGAFARLGSARFRHPGPVYHAAWSPDGQSLATGSHGGLSVWDADTGRLLRRAERKGVPFDRVAYSADGKTLYAVCGPTEAGCELLTFDAATLRETARVPFKEIVYAKATFSANGRRLAVFSLRPLTAIVIDSTTGKELSRVPQPRPRFESPNAEVTWQHDTFTPDGRQLVMASGDGPVRVHDAATGALVATRRVDRFAGASQARVLADGQLLSWVWSEARLACQGPPADGLVWKTESVLADLGLEVSGDGKLVAAVAARQVSVHSTATGKMTFRTDAAHPFDDGLVMSWDGTGTAAARKGVLSAAFSPDGRRLAVTARGGTVGLWATDGGLLLPQSSDPLGPVRLPRFTDGGRRLSVWSGDVWASWDLTAPARLTAAARSPTDLTVTAPDGRVAVRRTPKKPITVIDAKTGAALAEMNPPETDETLYGGQFTEDGRYFLGNRWRQNGSSGGSIGFGVWDTATWKRLYVSAADINEWTPSPDGRWIAVMQFIDRRHRLAVWETATGRVQWSRDTAGQWGPVTFSGDGRRAVAREREWSQTEFTAFGRKLISSTFVVLDAATGEELVRSAGPADVPKTVNTRGELCPFDDRISAVAPDGLSMAWAGPDGVVRVWELATDQERTRFVHAGPVHGLAYHPDGRTLAGASDADSVLLWDVTGLRTGAERPSAEALRRAWDDLGARDAAVGFRAMRTLAAGGSDGLRQLEDGIAGLPTLTPVVVAQWIKDLDAPEYRTREKAADALRVARFDVRTRLADARPAAGAEGKERIDAVLKAAAKYGPADLRRARAVETATMTGTEEARRLLDRWAKSDGLLAEDAKAAAVRIARR